MNQVMNKLDVSQAVRAFIRGSHQFKIGPVKMKGFVFKDAMTGTQERGHNGLNIMRNIAFQWSKLPIKELIFFVAFYAADLFVCGQRNHSQSVNLGTEKLQKRGIGHITLITNGFHYTACIIIK